ncbi:hypothetical protein [Glacieibacterium frigidum]|uniref:Lipoprotein n=1 Tax=Glacieibacterium frigidum TaxID=2593303 RepID=A0A552U922_9SPHN|nr:hypothetical protein [Glacieibacterium frigidum]TRW14727.1 hypothetical protein FMM06_13655 [Glacieibacterium frigidum]
MKRAAVLSVAMVLAACTDTPDKAKVADGAKVDAGASVATPAPSAAPADIEAAKSFIISRLNTAKWEGRDGESFLSEEWHPISVTLDASGWKWSPMRFVKSGLAGVTSSENFIEGYEVLPSALARPAKLTKGERFWQLRIECRIDDCIKVEGSQINGTDYTMIDDPEPTTLPIDERRDSADWYFTDQDTAERVARAVDLVLAAQGAKPRAF